MKVGGRDFDLTKHEVEHLMNGENPELIQKHQVEVNGQMFPPKQVLGHVTGWARLSFTTLEAQRVLTRIGFECTEVQAGAVRQAGKYVLEAVRDSARQNRGEHGEDQHRRGFSRAIAITFKSVDEKLDGLKEQMKGSGLSQADGALYAHLDELRSNIEAECDYYWRTTGVDWRPIKPVAKAISGLVDETDI